MDRWKPESARGGLYGRHWSEGLSRRGAAGFQRGTEAAPCESHQSDFLRSRISVARPRRPNGMGTRPAVTGTFSGFLGHGLLAFSHNAHLRPERRPQFSTEILVARTLFPCQ